MCRAAGQVDLPRPQLDEEQEGDRLEDERLAGEDVAGGDLVPVAREELAPGAAPPLPLRCGRHLPALEEVADGGAAHRVAQLGEFAVDARVAPPWVLRGQAEDQLDYRRAGGWAARAGLGPERPPADEVPMPAEDGLRPDEQQARVQAGTRAAAPAREAGGEHRQGQLLPAREPRRPGLRALEDSQLPPQQQDLDILALVRPHEQAAEVQEHPDELSEHREDHHTSARTTADRRHGSSGRGDKAAVVPCE